MTFLNNNNPYPHEKTIHSFFEDAAENDPHRTAVEFNDESITYGELNILADKLASILSERNISVGDVVAICAKRSINMVAAILGILKAGGAYLPINIDLPEERKRYYIETAKAKIIFSDCDDETLLGIQNININNISNHMVMSLNIEMSSDALAYIIFTSGTTGNPKGVMIKHNSVVNRLLWMKEHYQLSKKDVFLQKTPYSFDVSVWELFLWFFCGAKLCLVVSGQEGNIDHLLNVIEMHRVTICHFVPSMLSAFPDFLIHRGVRDRVASFTKVYSSGEVLTYDTVTKFNDLLTKSNKTQLHNLYGPTEATVDVTYFDCTGYQSKDKVVPIGRPIWNTNIYILDTNGNECLDGEEGEIYISGDGVALGYVNNLELTKKSFLPDPYNHDAIMYKTGDLGRWNNGNIEFLGRIDNQVQIHGIRIEPVEIENLLNEYTLISKSVVIAVGDNVKKLIAYYTGSEIIDSLLLTNYLSEKLPKYMIPVEYIFLKKFPHNQNGKIDVKELENMYINRSTMSDENNDMHIFEMIKSVVEREISFDDEFSQSDIDSITFIKIVVALENAFDFEFDDEKLLITEFPTFRSIVEYVESKINN